jgi:hypothetical protein
LLDGVYYSPDSASSQTRDAVLENQLAEYSGLVKAKLKTRGVDYTGYSSIDIMPTSSTFDFEVPVRENSKLELVFAVKNYESFPEQIESGAQDALTNVGTISFRFGMESCAIAEFPAPCMIDYAEIFESTAIIEKTRISSVLDLIDDESKRARAYMYMAMFYKDDAFCDEIKESYYYSQCIGDLSAKTGSIDTCLKNLDGDSSIKQFDAFKCIEGIDPNKELDYGALVSAIEQKPKPVHRLYFFLGEYYNTDRFCDNVSPSESGAPTCYKDTGVALKNVDTCLRALETTHSNRQWYTGWCIEQADESQVQDYVVLVEKIKSKPLPLDEVYSRVGGFYGDERYCENIDPSNDHAPECFRDAGITANDIDVCLRSIETTHENNVWYASWCVKLVDKDAQLDFDTLLAKINAKPGNKDYLFHELAEHYSDTRYCDSIADTSFFYLNCE